MYACGVWMWVRVVWSVVFFPDGGVPWLADGAPSGTPAGSGSGPGSTAAAVVKALYGMLCDLYTASTEPVRANVAREGRMRQQWNDLIRDTEVCRCSSCRLKEGWGGHGGSVVPAQQHPHLH